MPSFIIQKTDDGEQKPEGIEILIPTSPFLFPHSAFPRGVGPYGPYGFRLVDRAYSSERPEAAF
jgi:hypothetical protein